MMKRNMDLITVIMIAFILLIKVGSNATLPFNPVFLYKNIKIV